MTDLDDLLGEPIDGSTEAIETSVPESRRPALVRLSLDVEALVSELMAGFESREDVLRWARRMIPRTLGEIETEFYRALAEQFRAAGPRRSDLHGSCNVDRERTLLAALLIERERARTLPPDAVDDLRRRVAVEVVDPAYRRAFRQLRKSATEYVDDEASSDSDHDPATQRYIAMRPALDELDHYQRRATDAVLDGLDDADAVRRWGTLVELATHGEIRDDVLRRSVREPSTLAVLTADDPSAAVERARELFVAHYLLPAFNRGVRDLRDRAKEEPDADRPDKTAPMA